ncbi:MAG: hypothetical protein WAO35_28590 [Terriglobia bacterium]
MSSSRYRSSVTVDGTKFDAIWTSVKFSTQRDRGGIPEMGSIQTSIRVCVNLDDDTNFPHAALKKLFGLANVVTRDKIKDIAIEFWKDDAHQNAVCSYTFRGWIAGFETTSSPPAEGSGPGPHLNHILILDIEPAMNQQSIKEIKMGN